jgi:hypothetical protein
MLQADTSDEDVAAPKNFKEKLGLVPMKNLSDSDDEV